MFSHRSGKRVKRALIGCAASLALAGCSTMGGVGPTGQAVKSSGGQELDESRIQVVELTDALAAQLSDVYEYKPFIDIFGDTAEVAREIGPGDTLNIQLFESPPAVLFGNASIGNSSGVTASSAIATTNSFPAAIVDESGYVSVPFAGAIRVGGLTPLEAAERIRQALERKAHEPQVTVGIVGNGNASVSVLGDVRTNAMVALSPRGERLLDVIAQSGGVNGDVDQALIRVARDGQVASMPFETLLGDPTQNIRLHSGDVITAFLQTQSFVALGATGNNVEVPFEATGINLNQALARVAGLKDGQADTRGVFIFRYERPDALGAFAEGLPLTDDGLIPVIYRANMSKARTIFIGRQFQIRDGDVLYVSKAPLTDIRNFVQLLTQSVFSVINISNAVQ